MSQTETAQITPSLAPPGAGIPFYQTILLRLFVRPFIAAKSSPEASKKIFDIATAKIMKELDGLTALQLNKKILVPPQAGLEDSSRFWSISMVLEHLAIVGRKLCMVVEALSHDIAINEKADIAKLKPFGEIPAADSIEDFKKFASEEFSKLQVLKPQSKNKFKHPWFGDMTAAEWYWLIGVHQGLHLKQIRAIKKGLDSFDQGKT
jgi:hypothetical protein